MNEIQTFKSIKSDCSNVFIAQPLKSITKESKIYYIMKATIN